MRLGGMLDIELERRQGPETLQDTVRSQPYVMSATASLLDGLPCGSIFLSNARVSTKRVQDSLARLGTNTSGPEPVDVASTYFCSLHYFYHYHLPNPRKDTLRSSPYKNPFDLAPNLITPSPRRVSQPTNNSSKYALWEALNRGVGRRSCDLRRMRDEYNLHGPSVPKSPRRQHIHAPN